MRGGNGICDGQVDEKNLPAIEGKLRDLGFRHKSAVSGWGGGSPGTAS